MAAFKIAAILRVAKTRGQTRMSAVWKCHSDPVFHPVFLTKEEQELNRQDTKTPRKNENNSGTTKNTKEE